jgi:hypothetical protein
MINLSDRELKEYRKNNYWRGFFVCSAFVLLPVITIFMVVINNILKTI